MALPAQLSRIDRFVLRQQSQLHASGLAWLLDLLALVLGGVMLWRSLTSTIASDPRLGGLLAAGAGVLLFQAFDGLVWPRQRRLLALLYEACGTRERPGPA